MNIKSEGIEKDVINIVNKYNINNYFLLDVTFPFIIKYINKDFHRFAVRFSEFESIETCVNLKGLVEWVFIDNFTKLPLDEKAYSFLNKNFKMCVVSPELLGREHELSITKEILKTYPVDAILTDNPEEWLK